MPNLPGAFRRQLPKPFRGDLRTAPFFLSARRLRLWTAAVVLCLLSGWFSPARAREADAPAGGGKTPDPPSSIRFAAWNLRNFVHLAAPPPPGDNTRPKSPEEVRAIVSILVELRPDILGVCEVGGKEDLAFLQARLREAGLELPHAEHVEGADPVRHVALLSRFPITARNSLPKVLYTLDTASRPVERGFLDVTVEPRPGYRLRLVGAHLKSRFDVPEADQELMRRNEAHALRRHVEQILSKAPDTNLLVYGDFNETRDRPGVRTLRGTRGAATALTELPLTDPAGDRWTYYYKDADQYSRIDYLFASKGLLPEIIHEECFIYGGRDWMKASDHRPLVAVIHPGGRRAARTAGASTARSGE